MSLTRNETDAAIRVAARAPHQVKAHNFGPIAHHLYRGANPPEDLIRYITLVGCEEMPPELRAELAQAEIVMSVDGHLLTREYITQAVGIGLLANSCGAHDPHLAPISSFHIASDLQIWLLCLPEQQRLHRLQALMQFLRQELSGATPGGHLN